jgi:uncharacterized delta-60 repeat protein
MVNTFPVFGGNGNAGILTPPIGTANYGRAITVQEDGKILVMGWADKGVVVTRYLADGTLDKSFGEAGVARPQLGLMDYGYAMAVQADGRILVTGSSASSKSEELMLLRLTADGKPDTGFGTDGFVHFPYDNGAGTSLDVTPDGIILLTSYRMGLSPDGHGPRLLAFSPGGTRLAMFSGSDEFTVGYGNEYSQVLAQDDGKILLADTILTDGKPIGEIELQRLTPNGLRDTSFDPLAQAHTNLGKNLNQFDLAVQKDGKLVVAAIVPTSSNSQWLGDLVLMRYDGAKLDPDFGAKGVTRLDTGNFNLLVKVLVQSDGKLVVVGTVGSTEIRAVGLTRFNADGSIDKSFGVDGFMRTNFDTYDIVYGAALSADDKILVTGSTGVRDTEKAFVLRYNADGIPDASFGPADPSHHSPVFTENGPAVVLETKLTVTDAELAKTWSNFFYATLTLSRHVPNAEDMFSATGNLGPLIEGQNLTLDGAVVGTVLDNWAGTLRLQFGLHATQAKVNEVLQSIAYTNLSNAPASSITLDWVFNDGNVAAQQGTGGPLTAVTTTKVSLVGVNDAPSGKDSSAMSVANTPYVLGARNFGFTDAEDGATLTAVRIDTLPTSGSLRLQDVAVVAGQSIAASELLAGRLIFTGNGQAGPASLLFSVQDSTGTASTARNMLTFETFVPTLKGTAGNDLLVGTAAADKIFGGAGTDTVQLHGPRSNYNLVHDGDMLTVADLKGHDGSDTLVAIERIAFTDMTLAFDIDGNGGQAYRMYQAAFNRKPDEAGLGYWINAMDKGMTRGEVAQYFVDAPEFKTLYGEHPGNADLLNRFYGNVLHRAADADGFKYWLDLLDTHRLNAGEVLAYFAESPENQAALVGVMSGGIGYLPFG